MAAPRSGGDDLTENWESGTDEAQSSKKRKLDEQPTPKPAAASTPRPKKPKQIAAAITKAHTKASPAVAAVTSADAASARPLCFQSAEEQAGGFWQLYLQSKCGKMLTSIEQDESVPASAMAVLPTPSKEATDSCHPLAALPAHLRSALGAATSRRLSQPPASPPTTNSPLVLIVCSSAVRCTDYIKALRALHLPPTTLLKAFARHIKLAEQQAQLNDSDVRLAVGTPRRLLDLVGGVAGAMRMERLVLCVVDCQKDAKQYSLLTLPGVRDDWFALYQLLHPAVRAGKLRLALF